MSRHLSFRSGNPALNKNTFKNLQRTSTNSFVKNQTMTIKGTVDKTAISLILLIIVINAVMKPAIKPPIINVGEVIVYE